MEADGNDKYYNNLNEVVYIPTTEEKNKSQLLQSEIENKSKDSYFLYASAFTGELTTVL